MHEQDKLVYWERQGKDQMCGLHTLNSLLQGPLHDEVSLASIGLSLDQKEKNLLAGFGGGTNVNESGNFSLQVLIEALNSVGQFDLESIRSESNRQKNMR